MGMTDIKGATMKEARVCFERGVSRLQANLSVDGVVVVEGATVPEVARRLRAFGATSVALADGYTFAIPADSTSLSRAAVAELARPLETFYLIAACSWSEQGGEHRLKAKSPELS